MITHFLPFKQEFYNIFIYLSIEEGEVKGDLKEREFLNKETLLERKKRKRRFKLQYEMEVL
jgi:hypothetical protein